MKGTYGTFGRLCLARVVAHEVRVSEDGTPETDDNGNPLLTGLLRIELVDRAETREHVPYCLPSVGNASFMGSLPEIGSTCVVGWRAGDLPVIIGFLPFPLDTVSQTRGTVPNVEPGEVLLQGSKTTFDSGGRLDHFVGPRLWFDKVGRIRIDAEDYTFMHGYVLDREYDVDPEYVLDPVTEQPVLFRERVGLVERRVDRTGTEIKSVGNEMVERIAKLWQVTAGSIKLTSRDEASFQDAKGNGLFISTEDITEIRGNSGVQVKSGGTIETESSGDTAISSLASVKVMAGEKLALFGTGGNPLDPTGVEVKSVLGPISIQALAGDIEMFSATGNVAVVSLAGKLLLVGGAPAEAVAVLPDPFVMSSGLEKILAAIVDCIRVHMVPYPSPIGTVAPPPTLPDKLLFLEAVLKLNPHRNLNVVGLGLP